MVIFIILHCLVMSFNQLLNVFPCRQVISSSVTNSFQDILSGPCPSRPYSNSRRDRPVSQFRTNLIAAICHTQKIYHTWPVSILITIKLYLILEILPSAFPLLLGGKRPIQCVHHLIVNRSLLTVYNPLAICWLSESWPDSMPK